MELETINKLYLELSQITTATTAREILLQKQLAEAQKDEQRLDWIEAQVNKNGELHLHDGNHARGIGVGLRPGTLVRTLRAAIDAAKGESNA